MLGRITTTLLALVFGGQSVLADDVLRLRVDAGENLRYQLDCLSGYARCTRDSITLGDAPLVEADTTLLRVWRELRREDEPKHVAAPHTDALPLPTPASMAHISSRSGTRRAPAEATPGPAAHRRQLYDALIAYFTPRFEADWQDTHGQHLERLRFDILQLVRSHGLAEQLSRTAALFGQQPTLLPEIQLIAIRGTAHGSLATLEPHTAFVESPIGERAQDRLPVVVHEFVHHWLANMELRQQTAIVDAFTRQTDTCAMPAYHLFEETIASSIGNGYFERLLLDEPRFVSYLALPASFYADVDIDRLAKAMLPTVARYITESMRIDADFVDAYVAMASTTMAERCDTLAAQLRSNAFVLTSGALGAAQSVAQQRLGSTTTFTDVIGPDAVDVYLAIHSALSGIAVTTRDRLPALNGLLPAGIAERIDTLAAQHKRLVFGWRRSLHSTVYVVVGDNLANSEAALLQFAALTERRFEGIWLPPSLPGSGG